MDTSYSYAVKHSETYANRFERRPEFLFGSVVQNVIDANVKESEVHGLKVVRVEDVFKEAHQVFLVFGKPNTALVVGKPNGQSYERFSAYSMWRKPTDIVDITRDTGSIVQSGIWLRFFDLPEHASERIRSGMGVFEGQKHITCVRGNIHVLEYAGFTSGKKKLSKMIWPHELMEQLLKHGLFFEGKLVQYEVIRTTRQSMEDYRKSVILAEVATPWRHFQKSKIGVVTTRIAGIPNHLRGKKSEEVVKVKSEIAPALPSRTRYMGDIRVRVSSASTAGQAMQQVWGPHALFEALVDRVNVDDYLTRALKPFPQKNPPFMTRLKKRVLFSKPVVWQMRRTLGASKYQEMGEFSEVDVYDTLRTHSEHSSNVYNTVIVRKPSLKFVGPPITRIIIARITVRSKFIDWVLSKHVLMSGYLWHQKTEDEALDKDKSYVVWAGEFWKTADGVIRIRGNSGTYQPTSDEDDAVVEMIRVILPHLRVEKSER